MVQNVIAWGTMGMPQYVHVTPLLSELPWLQVGLRIQFKVLVIIYQAIQWHSVYHLSPVGVCQLCSI